MKRVKFFGTIFATLAVFVCLCIPTFAGYVNGSSFTDPISSSATTINLPAHTHSKIDIGANPINVTAPSTTAYTLELFVSGSKFGSTVSANTSGTGGYYYWESANPKAANALTMS